MAEIEDIMVRLEKIFAAIELKYVIVGGVAVIHYGHIRATQDIDLIIEDNPSQISQFLELLQSYEFDVMRDQFEKAYQEKTNISIFDKKSFLRLDIKVADTQRELEVLNNAIQESIFGKKLWIAPLEDILIGKILYIGQIEDIPKSELLEYQDIIDFLTLFHANREKLDFKFLKTKAKDMNLEKTLKKLLEIELQ